MAQIDYKKLAAERQKINAHFKAEKRKTSVIFVIFEILLLSVTWLLCNLLAPDQPYIWFFISLFFTLVFPITQFSKKIKQLTRQEKEQLNFAEQEY